MPWSWPPVPQEFFSWFSVKHPMWPKPFGNRNKLKSTHRKRKWPGLFLYLLPLCGKDFRNIVLPSTTFFFRLTALSWTGMTSRSTENQRSYCYLFDSRKSRTVNHMGVCNRLFVWILWYSLPRDRLDGAVKVVTYSLCERVVEGKNIKTLKI